MHGTWERGPTTGAGQESLRDGDMDGGETPRNQMPPPVLWLGVSEEYARGAEHEGLSLSLT